MLLVCLGSVMMLAGKTVVFASCGALSLFDFSVGFLNKPLVWLWTLPFQLFSSIYESYNVITL